MGNIITLKHEICSRLTLKTPEQRQWGLGTIFSSFIFLMRQKLHEELRESIITLDIHCFLKKVDTGMKFATYSIIDKQFVFIFLSEHP